MANAFPTEWHFCARTGPNAVEYRGGSQADCTHCVPIKLKPRSYGITSVMIESYNAGYRAGLAKGKRRAKASKHGLK